MDKKYTSLEHSIRNIVTESIGVSGTDEFKGTPRAFLKPAPRIAPKKGDTHPDGSSVLAQRGAAKIAQSETMKEHPENIKKIIKEFKETVPGQESKLKKSLEVKPSIRKDLKTAPEKIDVRKRISPSKVETKPGRIDNLTDRYKAAAEKRAAAAAEKAAGQTAVKAAEKAVETGAKPAASFLSKAAPYALDALKFAGKVLGTAGIVLDPILSAKPAGSEQELEWERMDPSKREKPGLPPPGPVVDQAKVRRDAAAAKANSGAGPSLMGMTPAMVKPKDVQGTKDLAGLSKVPMPKADVKGTKDLVGLSKVPMPKADVKGTQDLAGMAKIPTPKADVKGTSAFSGMPKSFLSPPAKPVPQITTTYPDKSGDAMPEVDRRMSSAQLPSAVTTDVTTAPTAIPAIGARAGEHPGTNKKSAAAAATTPATTTSTSTAGLPSPNKEGATSAAVTTAGTAAPTTSTKVATKVVTPLQMPTGGNAPPKNNDDKKRRRFPFRFGIPGINPAVISGLQGNVKDPEYMHYAHDYVSFGEEKDNVADTERRSIENVARPGGKTRIAKQGEIRTKIIDENANRVATVKKAIADKKNSTVILKPKLKHPELDEN